MISTTDRKFQTSDFTAFMGTELKKIYGEKSGVKAIPESIQYHYLDDSDRAGVEESMKFTMNDGRRFEARFAHKDSGSYVKEV